MSGAFSGEIAHSILCVCVLCWYIFGVQHPEGPQPAYFSRVSGLGWWACVFGGLLVHGRDDFGVFLEKACFPWFFGCQFLGASNVCWACSAVYFLLGGRLVFLEVFWCMVGMI